MRKAVVSALALAALPGAASAQPQPIPEGTGAANAPRLVGSPFTPNPLVAPDPPRHPHMAPNSRSNLHVDGYQTDVDQGPGPLGRGTRRTSSFHAADCASVTFDTKGRIVTVCVSLRAVTLHLKDARTLQTLAQMPLPDRAPGVNAFQNFTGGGYFYLDDHDRAIIPTSTRHIWIVRQTDAPGFEVERDHDLTAQVREGDAIISALPDWGGRIWFASRNGVVGTIDPTSGQIRSYVTHEPIGNSFAVDSDGSVFIVTDAALYRFEPADDGTPRVVWREGYPNDGRMKSGQTQIGSGTTPTLIGDDRVAITDNADPIAVMVFRREAKVSGDRLTCRQPVFERGASSTDQSLIATPDLIVAENNYGYTGPATTQNGASTTPGLARIDLHPSGRGCRLAWTSREIAPSVVPKLSAATGLVYTYTKEPRADGEDYWYLTGIDVRTGTTAFKAFAGEGLGFNNNYAPITLGPDGTAYVGVLGGLAALRDDPPPGDLRPALAGRPRLRLSCSRGRVLARVRGRRILRAWRGRVVDGHAPFVLRLRGRARSRVIVNVRMEGGARHSLRARAPRCSGSTRRR